MAELILFAIVLLFLIIFGCIMYMVTHYFINKWSAQKVKEQKRALWFWRLTIIIVIVYVSVVLFLNRNALITAIAESAFVLPTFLLIFFIALIELAVIDLLLPDVVPLWKRIIIECIILATLVIVTAIVFSSYSLFYSQGFSY